MKSQVNWINKYNVTVPSYQVIDFKIFFVIQLTKSTTCNSVPTSSSLNEVCTTLRSYSQFRYLWKTLRAHVLEPLSATQRHRQPIITLARKCCCAEDHCEFDTLHSMLRSFPFPSRQSLRSKLTGLDHVVINTRRNALEAFVLLLQNFFSEKLQDGNCLVLNAYVTFLGAAEHFSTDVSAELQRPLALSGWKQQCAEQILAQDKEEGDEEVMATVSSSKVHFTSTCAFEPRIVEDSMSCLSEGDEENLNVVQLSSLQVKTVRVHNMRSFMEEFCDHLLSQFASDIDELSSPELTQARHWEICLYVACRIGHMYAVQLILFNYADANAALADGSSCLLIAARMGQSEVVALLIEEGGDVNKANDVGVTPLIAACRNGCVDTVKLLLDAGADVSSCSKRGTYPLHATIVSQSLEIVSMLVESGANVNVMTASGITPLHFAAKLGASVIFEYLLRHNADPEKRTKSMSDAMMIAEANGHRTICELFQRLSDLVSSEQLKSDQIDDITESNTSLTRKQLLSLPSCESSGNI